MTLYTPLWMQAGGGDPAINFSAQNDRAAWSAVTSTEGVYWGLGVTQRGAGANFSVDVAAGQAVIAGDDVSWQGHYIVGSDAVVNVVVPAAPGSGSRIHRVVARVKDKLHNGAYTTYEFAIELLADTGSGTPALPGTAIDLALITVSSTTVSITNAEITDNRARALVHTALDENVASASVRPTNPTQGQRIWRTDQKYFEVWNGSSWEVHAHLSAPVSGFTETDQTTTSTSYVVGGTVVSQTFVAPPSGTVYITVSSTVDNSSASGTTYCSFELRNTNAAGSVVTAADDKNAVGGNPTLGSKRTLQTGLTAGNTYYVQTLLRSSTGSGTATAYRREILVEPHGS